MIPLDKSMFGIEEKILAIKVLSSRKLAQCELLGLFTYDDIAAEMAVSISVRTGFTKQEVDFNVSSLQKHA
jgi:hypothetical protein